MDEKTEILFIESIRQINDNIVLLCSSIDKLSIQTSEINENIANIESWKFGIQGLIDKVGSIDMDVNSIKNSSKKIQENIETNKRSI